VQSMDPAKVYGLAQVLADVAKTRQVIVFTHDDRLPNAVRHLQLDARILIVSRRSDSHVEVTGHKHGDPAKRYLDDARAITNDKDLDPKVRGRIVCHQIRGALEVTSHDLIRARDFRDGVPIAETEERISEATSLGKTLALALLGDMDRQGELQAALNKVDPAAYQVFNAANKGVHGGDVGPLTALLDRAERVVEKLATRAVGR